MKAGDAWDVDGVVLVPALITHAEIRDLLAAFEALRAIGAPTTRQVLYTHHPRDDRPPFDTLMEQWLNPHHRTDLVGTAAVLHRVGTVLNARFGHALLPFQDVLLSKHGAHRPFPWHQDEPYWPVDTPTGAVVWCALDPVSAANGGVELSLGSHLHGLAPAIDLHTGLPQHGGGPAPALSRETWCCPELAPGDALIFHPRMWHRSGVNRTSQPRRAWSSSWLPESARWAPDRAPRHPLATKIEAGARVLPALVGWRSS